MCAIMGILQKDTKVDKEVLLLMTRLLRHRGPDDTGIETFPFPSNNFFYGYGGIAFDRLSIRDLSQAGHQPMWSMDRKVLIAMNGEIYNADELREKLPDKGRKLRGNSDTEVLLNLYISYGLKRTLEMLDGMFAICIVDFAENKVYLIRDRIGEKPLYVYQTDDAFLFASEYKAFYCYPNFKAELDKDAISDYFLFRYPVGERTFIQGVSNLTPGSYVEISANGIKKQIWWQLPRPHKNNLSYEENKSHLKELIKKSVGRRLVGDRSIGIQLSGGVDSSYLSAVVAKEFKKQLCTYGITSDEMSLNEEKYIDYVTDSLKLPSVKIRFDANKFLETWRKATWNFEAPMNHEGTLALLGLNKRASKDVTVILCGDGPDECMGGYVHFLKMGQYKYQHHGFHWPLTKINAFIKRKKHYNSIEELCVSQYQYIPDEYYAKLFPHTYKKDIKKVYNARLKLMRRFDSGGGLRHCLNYEMTTYMQDILMRTDKVSMAYALEVRVPYLMPELLEFIQTIPEKYLFDWHYSSEMYGTKRILKDICSEEFGNDFTYRDKIGLCMPINKFFNTGDVREFIEGALLPRIKTRGIVDYDYIKSVWDSNINKMEPWSPEIQMLWCVFSFEIWAQMYIDSTPIEYDKLV